MHSLLDVHERPVPLELRSGPTGMPIGYPAKPFLTIPSEGKLTLPRSTEGLEAWSTQKPDGLALVDEAIAAAARVALLTSPTFVIGVPPPAVETVQSLVAGSKFSSHASGAAFVSAIRVDDSLRKYGVARTELVQNALGFGQSVILTHMEQWVDSVEDLAEILAGHLKDVSGSPIAPEPGASPWDSAILVLSGSSSELSKGRRDHLRRVAGLFRVDLKVVDNVRSRRSEVMANLRSTPPDGLLVMTESLGDVESFKSAFEAAKPNGYAGVIDAPASQVADQVSELCLHLAEFRALQTLESAHPQTWEEAVSFVDDLTKSDHFKLTVRAKNSIPNNPYPLPARMCEHLEHLAELALAFAAGDLGMRLDEYAKTRHGLNIALFDNSIKVADIKYDGSVLSPLPHVQVDDATSFDRCGRIYFAIDSAGGRFVVDHVGLHDYGT